MLRFLVVAIISISTYANIDQRLDQYIEDFNLKPIGPKLEENKILFEVGRELFFSPNLSGNKNISCATCHHPQAFTGDGLSLAVGQGWPQKGVYLKRHSPPLYNVGEKNFSRLFWDGRVEYNRFLDRWKSPGELIENDPELIRLLDGWPLAGQLLFPLLSPEEMLGQRGENPWAEIDDPYQVWSLIADETEKWPYGQKLKNYFSVESLHIGHLARAMAHFISIEFYRGNTPYDQYLSGKKEALTFEQKKGMEVFFTNGRCGFCHNGEHLTNFSFHSVAVPQFNAGVEFNDDLGMYPHVNEHPNARYRFKTPPLRNVAVTGPYMHNGAFTSLEQVIDHYIDPATSLKNFKGDMLDQTFKDLYIDRSEDRNGLRLDLISPPMRRISVNLEDRRLLLVFLREALTEL